MDASPRKSKSYRVTQQDYARADELISQLPQLAAPIVERDTTEFEQDIRRTLATAPPSPERDELERLFGQYLTACRELEALKAQSQRVVPIAQQMLCEVIVNGSGDVQRAITTTEAKLRRRSRK